MTVMEPKLDLVIAAGNYLGESPIWSTDEQSLYWVNCERPSEVLRWDSRTGDKQAWSVPQRIGGISLKKGGGLIATLADGLYDMQIPSGSLRRLVASPMHGASLHESATDRDGRIWVGAFDHRIGGETEFTGSGSLFRLERGQLIPVVNQIRCSNALAFSPDGTTLYHSDSTAGLVKSWTLDRLTGTISNEQQFAQASPSEGYFDGATVDAAGGFWVTLVFGGKLRRYHPDKSIDFEVKLPFSNPTKLAFGGPDLGTLFITSTKMSIGTPLNGEDMHGGVYAFKPGFRGMAEVAAPL
jgi:L-arabinonolactonase